MERQGKGNKRENKYETYVGRGPERKEKNRGIKGKAGRNLQQKKSNCTCRDQ